MLLNPLLLERVTRNHLSLWMMLQGGLVPKDTSQRIWLPKMPCLNILLCLRDFSALLGVLES